VLDCTSTIFGVVEEDGVGESDLKLFIPTLDISGECAGVFTEIELSPDR